MNSHPSTDLVAELRAFLNSGAGNYRIRLMVGNAADEIERLQKKLQTVASLLDEGAYGMATDEARGA